FVLASVGFSQRFLRGRKLLVMLLRRQVRNKYADQSTGIARQGAEGEVGRQKRAVGPAQQRLASAGSRLSLPQQVFVDGQVLGPDEVAQRRANQLLVRHFEQFRQPTIAIDDRTVGVQRRHA